MYLPPHFREENVAILHEAMRAFPLATLVTIGADGLPMASHLPMLLDAERGVHGTLLCHVARANEQWKTADAQRAALVMFHGPDAYVSPSFYPTKRETGKVVPTWNYIAVHVYGTIRAFDDVPRLHALVARLTADREGERAEPWSVDDAPTSYIEGQLRGIVGLEIPIERILGKWKLSQNKSTADRNGSIDGLLAAGDDDSHAVGRAMHKTLP